MDILTLPIEKQLIHTWINDQTVVKNIINTSKELADTVSAQNSAPGGRQLRKYIVYTDGSSNQHFTSSSTTSHILIMDQSAACFFQDINKSLAINISNWPLFTRPEVAAIFLALLTVPAHSSVNIYTDS
jgi:hypothetical protein